jgi:hypothetical protein
LAWIYVTSHYDVAAAQFCGPNSLRPNRTGFYHLLSKTLIYSLLITIKPIR